MSAPSANPLYPQANPQERGAPMLAEPVSVQLSKLSKKVNEWSKLIPKIDRKEGTRESFENFLLEFKDRIRTTDPTILNQIDKLKTAAEKIPSNETKSYLLKEIVCLYLEFDRVNDKTKNCLGIGMHHGRLLAFDIPSPSIQSEAFKDVCDLYMERKCFTSAINESNNMRCDYAQSEILFRVMGAFCNLSTESAGKNAPQQGYNHTMATVCAREIRDPLISTNAFMMLGMEAEALEAAGKVLDPEMKSFLLNILFSDSFEKGNVNIAMKILEQMDKKSRESMINSILVFANSFEESLGLAGKVAEKRSEAFFIAGLAEEAWIAIQDCKDPINPELIKALSKAFCERKDFETAKDMLLKIEDAEDQANAMDEVNAAHGLHLRAVGDLV